MMPVSRILPALSFIAMACIMYGCGDVIDPEPPDFYGYWGRKGSCIERPCRNAHHAENISYYDYSSRHYYGYDRICIVKLSGTFEFTPDSGKPWSMSFSINQMDEELETGFPCRLDVTAEHPFHEYIQSIDETLYACWGK